MTTSSPSPPTQRSAEGLQGAAAGVVTRLAAATIDLAVVLSVEGVLYLAFAAVLFLLNPRRFSWPSSLGWSVPIVALVIAAPYLAVAWAASGRSVGNLVLGLRVGDRDGRLLRPSRALLRAVACVLLPIGLLWIPVDPYRRSLQDLLLGTSVTYDWRPRTALRT